MTPIENRADKLLSEICQALGTYPNTMTRDMVLRALKAERYKMILAIHERIGERLGADEITRLVMVMDETV